LKYGAIPFSVFNSKISSKFKKFGSNFPNPFPVNFLLKNKNKKKEEKK
jgi:hypothetical protein